MFDNILVPMDGSADSWVALDRAIQLAKEKDRVIHGLHVIDIRLTDAPYSTTWYGNDYDYTGSAAIESAIEFGRQLGERGQKILARLVEKCDKAGIQSQTEQVNGIITQTILDRAKKADLIVMGHYGEGARWAGPLFGSTFETVVRYSPVPIWVSQAELRPTTHLLAAYDGSNRAQDSLEIAAGIAVEDHLPVTLITVDDGHPGRQQAYQEADDWLRQKNLPVNPIYWKGHPAEEIIRAARVEGCDLIVMGAYGHSHFLEIFFGSTVDDVMRGATCPLLICR
jgi:nucleotide-binding universal stress UspA family protein